MKPEIVRGKIKKDVQAGIHGFLAKFQGLPFHYMSESDIQAELFVRIRDQINWGIDLEHESMKHHSFRKTIDLINTEYSERIDIVCLDPLLAQEEIRKRENRSSKLSDFLWRLPVLIGIEIKLVRFDDFKKGIDFCREDAKKLKDFGEKQKRNHNLKPSWLMLCFFQNSEALKKMVENETYTNIGDRLPDYDKIHLIASGEILQLNI